MFKPLDGVKVIDLTYFVAGPGARPYSRRLGRRCHQSGAQFRRPRPRHRSNYVLPYRKGLQPILYRL